MSCSTSWPETAAKFQPDVFWQATIVKCWRQCSAQLGLGLTIKKKKKKQRSNFSKCTTAVPYMSKYIVYTVYYKCTNGSIRIETQRYCSCNLKPFSSLLCGVLINSCPSYSLRITDRNFRQFQQTNKLQTTQLHFISFLRQALLVIPTRERRQMFMLLVSLTSREEQTTLDMFTVRRKAPLDKTAHFTVAFYCDQPKAHLCTNHTKFVNNILEKYTDCVCRKSLKWDWKQKCCVYIFVQYILFFDPRFVCVQLKDMWLRCCHWGLVT